MNDNSITSLWTCECSSKNQLRFRKCRSCGCSMPDIYAYKIYSEELKRQKALARIENFEASKVRLLKLGSFLEKMKSVVVPVTVVLVIALNFGRIYLDRAMISNYMFESGERRQERLWNEVDNIQRRLTGLKSMPLIAETIYSDLVTRATKISEGIGDNRERPEKHIVYGKIDRAKIKIEGAIEYVTNKFK